MLNRVLIVWIVYAGVMGFAVGGSFVAAYQIPLSQHEARTNPEQNPSDQNSKEKSDEALARYTLWLTIFTGVMAFATVGLGIATVGLYATGEKQIEVAMKTASAAAQSAEAQIAVEGARLTCLPISNSYWNEIGQWADRWPNSPEMPLRRTFAVLFVLKNYGKTPATIAGVNARLIYSPEPPSDIYIESPFLDLPAEIVVGAGLRSEGQFKVESSQFFRLEEAIQLQNGEMNIWFNGRIIYDDVFGRVGTQVFLYKVRSRGGFTQIWDQTTYRQK